MSEGRSQFTFYDSFYRALSRIKKKADRADAYDAIVRYALTGEEPDMDMLPDAAAIAFEVIRPNLDSSRKKAENGRLGGRPKKQTESKPKANQKQKKANRKQEQEKEQEKEQMLYPPLPPEGDEKAPFEIFWDAYPKKKGKAKAMDAFAKAIKKTDLDTMLAAIEAQKLSHDWQKENGQFIPYPSSWLNGCRWEDEVTQAAPAAYVPLPDNIPDNGW